MTESGHLAILFADISGSTQLYEQLGDKQARELVALCMELLSESTITHGGRVVKTIGDEIMSVFPAAEDAARAAINMQEKTRLHGESQDIALKIRIGFHAGPVLLEDQDVFGDAVNLAARIAAQAKAEQILTTEECVAQLDQELQKGARRQATTTVKGKSEPVTLFELFWGEQSDVTMMAGVTTGMGKTRAAVLQVRFQGSAMEMNSIQPHLSIGRGEQNQIVVPDSRASRTHAYIELRRDRFMLIDISTNGCHVLERNGEYRLLRRDELELSSEGVIGPGLRVAPGDALAIHYILHTIG